MMKKQEVIAKVLRAQRTTRSLQTLKVIQLMNFKARTSSKPQLDEEARTQTPVTLCPEMKATLQEVFRLFDTDESGYISVMELMSVFRSLGQHISEEESSGLIRQLDRDGDGKISFNEFCTCFQEYVQNCDEQDPEECVRSMFSIFDSDQSGEISTSEFTAVLQKLGPQLTPEDIQAIVEEVDHNGDGMVSLEEFSNLIRHHILLKKRKMLSKVSFHALESMWW